MAVKCPKCHSENTDTARFCSNCATQLIPPEGPSASKTLTLETKPEGLTRGTVVAERYEILERLGTGGMGTVYRVYDRKLEEEVALKLIRPEIAVNRQALERFKNELKVARKITHKSVCRMYDIGESGGTSYITMEYVGGEDLKSVIHRMGTITMGKAVSIAQQVAEGLAETHKLGIIHRDLKPGNVMIDKEGQAKIMDFGIARSLAGGGTTAEGAIIGTPEYMSPEQAEGKEVDQRSDIYALGIILFEMVTGRLPFEGETPFSIANKQKSEPPPVPKKLNPQIPAELDRVILRSLEKAKEKRYQTTGELLADLAAVEEALPTGERISAQPKTSREITVKFTPKKLFVPALALLVLVAAGIILWRYIPRKETVSNAIAKKSIAVLPFVDMSPQKDQEYFCDGMTEELINRLSNIKELRVPARTSAFFFKGKEQDIREIGRKLDVRIVLEGSVRRAGNELRITAQLINVADGYHLWSETYDRELRDIFSIQDEIALEIINKLKIKLLGEVRGRVVKRYTDNTEAYDSYMRGMWLFNNKATEGDWRKAILHFERAIELDPSFSLAYVGLAGVNIMLSLFHLVSADEAIPKAKKALEQALKIDPELPEALAFSGTFKLHFEYDLPGAESDIKKALELNPNYGLAHLGLAHILLSRGQIDKAIEEASAALELDLLSLRAQMNFAWNLYQAGRYDDALKQCKKSLELDPEYSITLGILGLCYVQKSLFQEAIDALQRAVAFSGNNTELLSYLAYAYVMSGNLEKAHEILRELDMLSKRVYVSKYYLASVQAAIGDKDKAFESLESAYKERDGDLIHLKTDPKFDVLRSDPRFEMILKKIGLKK